jgi:predicted nucleic acid-binding protein
MHSDFPVLLDACVLANGRVCDLYLRLAEHPRLYSPLWSEAILKEVHRTQTTKLKRPYSTELADYWRSEVTAAFPEAVVRDWEPLLPSMGNDPKDRHVLAAACKAHASVIVTFNLRDFPLTALQPHGIEAVHPQDYLLTLWEMHPTVVAAKLLAMARDQGLELEDLVIQLGKSVPRFSSRILADMGISGSNRPRL